MSAQTPLPVGQVTFLFTDIEGSTRLAQQLGDDYREMLVRHRQILRDVLTASGGVELFTEGDSYFFAFGDATDAVTACAAAQRRLDSHDWRGHRPRVRMGLHTGHGRPESGEYTSPEVHRAARITAAAHGGQVLLSAATAEAAGPMADTTLLDLGLHRLRGFDGCERLFQLVASGLERHFPRLRAVGSSHNLPTPLTSFVGRAAARAELSAQLDTQRLVTLVGPGGAGKSRLAVAVATDLLDRFADGVWLVDVAEVADAGLVICAIATALGLRPEPGRPVVETVVEAVQDQELLLVLDTCEAQLTAVRSVVSRLLAGATDLHVLATSREPLGLPGELVWRTPPLAVTGVGADPGEAVALLAERTAQARGGIPVSPAELADLALIAARLDGLPLALELAAARLRVMSAAELVRRLRSELTEAPADPLCALDAGTPADDLTCAAERHRTMTATVTWSYRTLPEDAARLLRALSVFAGPVELSTVEFVAGEDPLAALTVLVDKSLLQVERTDGGTVYRMLDPIRAYAGHRLEEAGEGEAARDRHVAWALHALRAVGENASGLSTTHSLYRIDPLAVELRTALRWCARGGSARRGLRISACLEQWWRERGLAREGRLWLFRLYARIAETGESVPDAELAQAYHAHSGHAAADGDHAEELRFAQRADAAARRAAHPGLLARVLSGRAGALRHLGRPEDAERACRDVLAWARRHDVAPDALFAVYNLAEMLWLRGAWDEAADLLAVARPLEQAAPAVRGRRTVDMLLGLVALQRRDLVAAHEHLTAALRSRMAYGFHGRACVALKALAVRCVLAGDTVTGVTLFGAAESSTARLLCGPGAFGPYWKEHQQRARDRLGDAAFDEAYARGSAMSLVEATSLALRIEHPDLGEVSHRFDDKPPAVDGPGRSRVLGSRAAVRLDVARLR